MSHLYVEMQVKKGRVNLLPSNCIAVKPHIKKHSAPKGLTELAL